MKEQTLGRIQTGLIVGWSILNLSLFIFIGHWLVGVIMTVFFLGLVTLAIALSNKMNPQVTRFDERQIALRTTSYRLGLLVGLVASVVGMYFFAEVMDFAYFIICATITAVVGFQALTGSHFGFTEKKKSVLSSYIIFIILGGILFFLYLRDFYLGTQQFIAHGKVAVDGVFWVGAMFLIVGFCGLMSNLEKK